MTVEEYYRIVERLGLHRSTVPHIFFTKTMDVHPVPNAHEQTEAQRAETIERLKLLLGITWTDDDH